MGKTASLYTPVKKFSLFTKTAMTRARCLPGDSHSKKQRACQVHYFAKEGIKEEGGVDLKRKADAIMQR